MTIADAEYPIAYALDGVTCRKFTSQCDKTRDVAANLPESFPELKEKKSTNEIRKK